MGAGGEQKKQQDGLTEDMHEFPPSMHSFSKNYSPNGFGDITKRVDRSSADGFFVSFQQFQQLKTNPHPLPCWHILSTPKRHKNRSSSPHLPRLWNDKHSSTHLSAILPTKSMQFSCTFSCLFFRMGVSRGSRSLIGGVILCIPANTNVNLNQSPFPARENASIMVNNCWTIRIALTDYINNSFECSQDAAQHFGVFLSQVLIQHHS